MLAILAFEVTIYRHQEYYRGRNNLTAPVSKTIFHDITRLHLDDGLVNCAKYFINYFFYKFGLEVSLLADLTLFCKNSSSCFGPGGCWGCFIAHLLGSGRCHWRVSLAVVGLASQDPVLQMRGCHMRTHGCPLCAFQMCDLSQTHCCDLVVWSACPW